MKSQKNKFFGINFDPKTQPGYQTRYKSMDSLIGEQINPTNQVDPQAQVIAKQDNSREKFKSQTVPQNTPSVILRKKGWRP